MMDDNVFGSSCFTGWHNLVALLCPEGRQSMMDVAQFKICITMTRLSLASRWDLTIDNRCHEMGSWFDEATLATHQNMACSALNHQTRPCKRFIHLDSVPRHGLAQFRCTLQRADNR